MVNFCSVFGCSNRSNRNKVSYFSFPSVIVHQGEETKEISSKRREQWLSNLNRKGWTPTKHSRVCSDHFHAGKPADLYDPESPDWAPTLNLGHQKKEKEAKSSTVDRYKRAKRRSAVKRQDRDFETVVQKEKRSKTQRSLNFTEAASEKENAPEIPELLEQTTSVFEMSTQTDLTASMINQMESELCELRKEKQRLKDDLDAKTLDIDSFRNEEKTKYYTGLSNFAVLMTLFNFVQACLPDSSKLSKFQELLVVLMRLRLGCQVQDLAFRFNVSKAHISRTFLTVIDILNARLSFLLKWPTREQLYKTMPLTFREHFGQKVAVIIDCFEVFIERPSNLKARAQTWSNYKHHNTVKFLIGITPQGVISFLSKAWGGRASDKHVTENSGFLDNLLPGDLVLADRGFNIAESVGLQHAQLNIPAFTKGKQQLTALDVETTRKIAHVRIHVERVIGSLRQKYSILQNTIPITFLQTADTQEFTTLDKIARVCCALTNLSDSVVPRE